MRTIILSGAPGSGKTSWAESLNDDNVVRVSADDFFYSGGVWEYDPSKIGLAHQACLRAFLDACSFRHHTKSVVVDNTNTTLVEMAPYIRIAQACDMPVEIRHFLREGDNKHGVPPDKVDAMRRRIRGMLLDDFGVAAADLEVGCRRESRTFRGVYTEIMK